MRRLWLLIFIAMLIPVGIAVMAHWFEAENRRVTLQNQELIALSRDKASTLLFNGREMPDDFARGLEGRYLVVLDGAGSARFSNAPVPDELVQLFARRSPHAIDAPSGTTILAWYASGREWRGAMTYLPAVNPGDPASASIVVVFSAEAAFGASATKLVPTAAGLLLLSVLASFAVAALIGERYLPPLRALQRGLIRLRERRFEPLTRSAVGEFAPLEREFNTTALSLSRDWRAFEVLGEVDRALLAASEIDRALDTVLPLFRELTRAQCVSVILLDPTAHSHGRLFMAALGADELPVQRVTFDLAMIATVREAPEGLTIARIEESRPSFLVSMRDVGITVSRRATRRWPTTAPRSPSACAPRCRTARATNACIARRTTTRSRSCRTARCFATDSRRSWRPRPPGSRAARSCTWTWTTSNASTTRWATALATRCSRWSRIA
jgi:hypothetical protein